MNDMEWEGGEICIGDNMYVVFSGDKIKIIIKSMYGIDTYEPEHAICLTQEMLDAIVRANAERVLPGGCESAQGKAARLEWLLDLCEALIENRQNAISTEQDYIKRWEKAFRKTKAKLMKLRGGEK